MEREEAVNWLKLLKISPLIYGAYPEAIDMAIEALSAEAEQGEWILVKGSNGKDYHKCSKCLHTQEITGVKNYCAVCGAKMTNGGDDE